MEVAVGIEPTDRSFADSCLTTWLRHRNVRAYMKINLFNSVILENDPVRLGNRTYRVWEKLELPKYFLNLHQSAPTKNIGIEAGDGI